MLVKRSGLGNENVGGRGRCFAKTKSLSPSLRVYGLFVLESPPSNDAQHECVLGPPAAKVHPTALDIKGILGTPNLLYPTRQRYPRDSKL